MNTSPLNIILAEDDESDRINFSEAIGESRIKTSVHIVNDGVELMEYLEKKNTILPDLLFLDLNMPRKNGLQCLKEIRADEKFQNISVAIYSTSSTEQDIMDTFLQGANVYIRKPNNFAKLKEALDSVVRAASMYRDPPFNISNFVLKID